MVARSGCAGSFDVGGDVVGMVVFPIVPMVEIRSGVFWLKAHKSCLSRSTTLSRHLFISSTS
jgi:hypothetical protein